MLQALAAHHYAAQGPSQEELAYQQGMADYAAAVAAASGLSPEELAYYQGMADYAAALG